MASVTKFLSIFLLFMLAGPLVAAVSGMARVSGDWRTASRDSAGIAPDPALLEDPIIQVYGARAFGWRGAFAVHTWIATKQRGADTYQVYEVTGWRFWHGQNPVSRRTDRHPDRHWFGARPVVYLEHRGDGVEAMIDEIEAAIDSYPYQDSYRTWPGPNSNTFTAHVARSVPGLRLDLPPTAIGKDYLGATTVAAAAPSSTGFQVSLFGLLGFMIGLEEGIEVNVLGLTFGLDPNDLAIKLPGLGRLGPGGP
jgi:hypothetical protein